MGLSSGVFCAILKKHRAPGSVQAPIRQTVTNLYFTLPYIRICRKRRLSVITSASDEKSAERQSSIQNNALRGAGCLVQ